MTNGKRRMHSRKKSFQKWKQTLGRKPTDLERQIFRAAFGMGWKDGKKRQLQLIENGNKMIDKNTINSSEELLKYFQDEYEKDNTNKFCIIEK